MKLLVPRKYRQRHKILEILNRKTDNQRYRPHLNLSDWIVSAKDIQHELKIGEKEYRELVGLMWDRKEVQFDWKNNEEQIVIRDPGMTALNEEKYLNEAMDRFWRRTEKIIIVATVLVSLAALIIQFKSQSEISTLQNRVRMIEDSLK